MGRSAPPPAVAEPARAGLVDDRPYPQKPCAWCGDPIPRRQYPWSTYQRLKYCSWWHSAYARAGHPRPSRSVPAPAPERRRSRNILPRDPITRFPDGIAARTQVCPRCAGLLRREPALLRCRLCGRNWRILGADYRVQMEFERTGALVHPQGGGMLRRGRTRED